MGGQPFPRSRRNVNDGRGITPANVEVYCCRSRMKPLHRSRGVHRACDKDAVVMNPDLLALSFAGRSR